MNSETIDKIIELNKHFYETISDDFSNTRQNYWQGWDRLLNILKSEWKDKKKVSVCDLGCGNGRFYKFLVEKFPNKKITYSGYDISEKLLQIAKDKFKQVEFNYLDIINNIKSIKKKFDLVSAFGITHHVPSSNLRMEWHRDLGNLIEPNGIICLTYWHSKKYKNIPETINTKDLDKGDYFLGWDKEKVYRYVHEYQPQELEKIQSKYKSNDIHLLKQFLSDGKDSRSNTYSIYKKQA